MSRSETTDPGVGRISGIHDRTAMTDREVSIGLDVTRTEPSDRSGNKWSLDDSAISSDVS